MHIAIVHSGTAICSENRVKDALAFAARNTTSGIVITDPAGRIQWVNTGFESITGWTLAEVQGRRPSEFLHGADTDPATLAKMHAARRAGEAFEVEVLNFHKAGHPYWLKVEGQPNRDATGKLIGYTAIQVDITRQVQTAHALQETAERLQLALDASRIGVWRLHLQTGTFEWDARMKEMSEWPPGVNAPTGPFLLRLIHPCDRAWVRRQLKALGKGRESIRGEVRMLLPSGSVRPVETRVVLSRDTQGRPAWVTGANIDISDRKQNEDALRASFRDISDLKAAMDEHAIIAVTDPAGRITRVNDRFCAISGYSRQELLGANHRLINSNTHPPDFFREMWRTIASGQAWHGEVCNRNKLGALYWVETTIVPFLGHDGKPSQYIAIRADITARKTAEQTRLLLEEELARTSKLQTLGDFAGGIAHDFNNLIVGIAGHVELAIMDLPPQSSTLALLRTAERGCERARELAKRLLMFARRGPTPDYRPIDMAKLVRETIPIISPTLGMNVSVAIDVQPALPAVFGDEGQMMQVLMNLCLNGAHAMSPAGGTLTVTVKTARLEAADVAEFPATTPGAYIILQVSDSGCGMDAATRARVFEPYFTTKSHGKGTGLGLAVVNTIIRQHQGVIRVQSEPGQGARFEIFLPLAKDPAATNPHTATRCQRILVVDDDPPMLLTLVQVLRARGYDAHGASNPILALATLKQTREPYHLLLSDYCMPEMSGLELALQARRIYPNLPVVIISGQLARLSIQQARDVGINALVPKPLQAATLISTIDQVLTMSSAA